MHSPFSSATLAVNAFAPWVGRAAKLELAGQTGFDSLTFEEKCPIWPDEPGAPNLDLIARPASGRVVAVEPKCTEPLGAKKAKFKPKYEECRDLMHRSWERRYDELLGEADRSFAERHYQRLDAAQLVKHYLG